MRNGLGSFWLHDAPDPCSPRPRLEDDLEADVVIVGGGFTGLWTAYWLKRHDPALDVVVLEQDRVGYGASGRNGGWLSGKTVAQSRKLVDGTPGRTREDALRMERACFRAVDEVLALTDEAGLDIDAHRGGWLMVARTEAEAARLRHKAEADHAWGLTEDEVRLLTAEETRDRIDLPGLTGGYSSPFAARVQPARLAYAAAALAEGLGVRIFENTRVESCGRGHAEARTGSVRSGTVVLATEGYTADLPGRHRQLLPMFSSMLVTRPLPPVAWERIGWADAECVSAASHLYFYMQRTADDRIAIGGPGKVYEWRSGTGGQGTLGPRSVRAVQAMIRELFPRENLAFEHVWTGVMGVPRDWAPFIDVDPSGTFVQVGGYVGQGVAASYVAGRSVADILTGRDSELVDSLWVRRRPRSWEPEPLRLIGTGTVELLSHLADRDERRRGGDRTSVFADLAGRIGGH